MDEDNKSIPIDPRTALILLVTANLVSFTQRSIHIELSFIAFLFGLLYICNCKKWIVKWSAVFIIVLLFQYIIFPMSLKVFATSFSILFVYLRKLLPCLIVGTILVKRIKLRYITLALEKWHFPQKIIIPIMILLRYLPTIYQDRMQIKKALTYRNIHGFERLECYFSSIMIGALNISDELAAAAVTRGIENPCPKTCAIDITMKKFDWFLIIIGFLFIILAICSRRYLL